MRDWIAHFRAAACRLCVSHVWRGHGSALFVEFGELTHSDGSRRDGSLRAPKGDIGLMIEWSWRIEDDRSIICGSWSDEELWGPSFKRVVGQHVTDLNAFGRLPELMISLSPGLHVTSFMTAEGDPQWTLFDRRSSMPIVVGCRSGVITEVA